MNDLAAILGPGNAEKLARAAGGTRLSVPKHFGKPPNGGRDSSARLVALVGEELAILLVMHFGNSSIYVPSGNVSNKPLDRRKLKRLEARGLSCREIASALGCSYRTVEKHRAKSRAYYLKRKDPK